MIQRLLALAFLVPSLAWATCPSDHYGATICADNPNHWWRMDAASGTTENDVGISAALNATYSGGFTLGQTGIPGATPDKAVLFNGSTGVLETTGSDGTTSPDTTATNVWSAEVWVNIVTLPSSGNQIAFFGQSKDTGTSAESIWRIGEINNSGTQEWVNATTNSTSSCNGTGHGVGLPSSPTPTTGAWWYLVMKTTANGSGDLAHQKLYVNASSASDVTSFTGSLCGITGQNVVIAASENHPLGFLANATIDEAATYGNPGLSDSQITNHYNAGIMAPATGGLNAYSVKRPELPHFRDDIFWKRFVSRGYNTGQWAESVLWPRMVGWFAPFSVVPNGHGE